MQAATEVANGIMLISLRSLLGENNIYLKVVQLILVVRRFVHPKRRTD
jgi:hypothetical protein